LRDTYRHHGKSASIYVCADAQLLTHSKSSTISDNKETQNDHDPPCVSLLTSLAKDDEAHPVLVIHTPAGSSDTEYRHPLPYVGLSADFMYWTLWSNDPSHLSLQTYFNPKKPNLAKDFNVPSLHPILREDGGHDNFILTDDKDRIYVRNEMDGRLFWVRHKEIEELESVEDKVDFVICAPVHLDALRWSPCMIPITQPKTPSWQKCARSSLNTESSWIAPY
jgi:hypothetical protein